MAPLDGSSLEALLKGEPMDKRAAPELRNPEEEQSMADVTGTAGASSHSGSTRVRKVCSIWCRYDIHHQIHLRE